RGKRDGGLRAGLRARAGHKAPDSSGPEPHAFDRRGPFMALTALRRGDFTVRLPADWTGLDGKIADTFNDVVELNEKLVHELERLRQVVGREGRILERGSIGD